MLVYNPVELPIGFPKGVGTRKCSVYDIDIYITNVLHTWLNYIKVVRFDKSLYYVCMCLHEQRSDVI